MNNRIYSRRRNPSWLLRAARWLSKLKRQIVLYRFYRGLKHPHRDAWDKANRTL